MLKLSHIIHNPNKPKKTGLSLLLALSVMLTLATPEITLARQGDGGYEGGISSGETPSVTKMKTSSKYEFQYTEPSFVSGIPIILTGTLTLSKTLADSKTGGQTLTSKYDYNLKNTGKAAVLTRSLTFVTTITPKENGQKTQQTKLTKATETLKINADTYKISSIKDYELSKSILSDEKPAVNYYLGTLESKKTYHIGTTTDTVVVESTCNYSGYDEYWSSAEAQVISETISRCTPGKADVVLGSASINISQTTKKALSYNENIPIQTSVAGGYIQTQQNENILKYTANLSELDKNKKPTRKVVKYEDSLKLNSSKSQESLVSPALTKLKGHPSEKNIRLMFGLEAFKDQAGFDPQEYISRAEFIDAFINVGREVPLDNVFTAKKTTTTSKKKTTVVSPFRDVPVSSTYFNSISNAVTRKLVSGNGLSQFRPDASITIAEAVTILINSMGLTGLAPSPEAVTSFRDNDSIPAYARASMYVAEKIGLIEADEKGYIYPASKITKAAAANMLKAYVDHMSSDIRKEYQEKILSYKN